LEFIHDLDGCSELNKVFNDGRFIYGASLQGSMDLTVDEAETLAHELLQAAHAARELNESYIQESTFELPPLPLRCEICAEYFTLSSDHFDCPACDFKSESDLEIQTLMNLHTSG
jgi:Zn finger protein HypA/HybF involved in hydrogenase expression